MNSKHCCREKEREGEIERKLLLRRGSFDYDFRDNTTGTYCELEQRHITFESFNESESERQTAAKQEKKVSQK